jgi:hypothetical protein
MTTDYTTPHLVPDDPGDAALTRALRALYAAPEGEGYWSALERRIMHRITGDESLDAWWIVPAQWARIGLIAAGFALIVAGSLYLRSRAEQRQIVFESVVDPTGGPTLAIREGKTAEQGMINYINGR